MDIIKDLHCFTKDSFSLKATSSGILDSKAFVVKDLFAIKDHISSFGNIKWRQTHKPSNETASVISKLLESGADMMGIVKMEELAYSVVGNVGEGTAPVNSLYHNRFSGGSSSGSASSGSASAVSGGIADFALGTDTCGSIRVPAAACGLYSIRPTYGQLDSKGVLPLANSFDTVGIMAKDANILRKVFEVVAPNKSNESSIKRIMFPIDILDLVNKSYAKALEKEAQKLALSLNTKVEEITLGKLCSAESLILCGRLQNREIWEELGDWIRQNQSALTEDVRKRILEAEKFSQDSNNKKHDDHNAWEEYKKHFASLITAETVIVMPIIESLPPKLDATDDELEKFRNIAYQLNAPASLSGAPEVVKPIQYQGFTYGMGLLGAKESDYSLLKLL